MNRTTREAPCRQTQTPPSASTATDGWQHSQIDPEGDWYTRRSGAHVAPWSRETRGGGATRLPLVTPDRETGQRYAAVTVRDHGPGMAREHLPRLTERFYRVEGQKSGERQGTGLGLAIVKHIVNRHRGGLTVESAPGQGAAFTAYFPIALRREPPPVV